MLVIQPESLDSCLTNILLQNLANANNKNLCTHFVDPNAFSILLRNIHDWYIEDRSYIWIVGIPINNDVYTALSNIVPDSDCKFIYVDSSVRNDRQNTMIEYLEKNSNFKALSSEYNLNSLNVLQFMKNKSYDLSILKQIYSIIHQIELFMNFKEFDDGYLLHTLYDSLGFWHFKENFIDGVFKNGLRIRAESIVQKKKKHIKRLYEKSIIQQSDNVVLAMTDFNIMFDLIYFTSMNKKIVNMITLDDEIHIEIFIKDSNVTCFLDEIQIKKYFQSEIISYSGDNSYGIIRLREKIKYSSAVSIIKYLYSEMST